NRENVMKQKFDDIRSREKSSRDFNRDQNRSKDVRRDQFDRSKNFQREQDNRNRKEFDTRKLEKNSRDYKSYSKPRKEEARRPEPPSRSNYDRFEQRESSVKTMENHSRRMPEQERSYSSHQSENRRPDFSRQTTKSDHG